MNQAGFASSNLTSMIFNDLMYHVTNIRFNDLMYHVTCAWLDMTGMMCSWHHVVSDLVQVCQWAQVSLERWAASAAQTGQTQGAPEENLVELTSTVEVMLDLYGFMVFAQWSNVFFKVQRSLEKLWCFCQRDSAGVFGIFHFWRPQLSIWVPAALATTGTFTHPKLLAAFAAWKQLPKVPREILVIQDLI